MGIWGIGLEMGLGLEMGIVCGSLKNSLAVVSQRISVTFFSPSHSIHLYFCLSFSGPPRRWV